MPIGVDGFVQDLCSPRLGVGTSDTPSGPGAYERLFVELRALGDDPRLLAPLAEAWRERAFETEYARPLLLLAALRYRALEDAEHPLAFEVLMDAEAPELGRRLLDALADRALVPVLRERAIQTNEPGRAFAWGLPALTLGLSHRGFHIVDLGASAGLNLVVDRTSIPYRFGLNKLAGFDFPSPERRLGLDRAPIDVTDPREARWLEACIWPGQPERLERFKACRKVYQDPWRGDAPAPRLVRHELGAGATREALTAIADDERATLVYESVVRPYLAPAARAAHDADLWGFLAAGRERLWAVLEPSEIPSPSTPMTLTVHLVRDGERHALPLAQSGYHSASCVIVPGAPRRLVELWRSGA